MNSHLTSPEFDAHWRKWQHHDRMIFLQFVVFIFVEAAFLAVLSATVIPWVLVGAVSLKWVLASAVLYMRRKLPFEWRRRKQSGTRGRDSDRVQRRTTCRRENPRRAVATSTRLPLLPSRS